MRVCKWCKCEWEVKERDLVTSGYWAVFKIVIAQETFRLGRGGRLAGDGQWLPGASLLAEFGESRVYLYVALIIE